MRLLITQNLEESINEKPHTFLITVNGQPDHTDLEVMREIIFESCNIRLWDEHEKINIKALNKGSY